MLDKGQTISGGQEMLTGVLFKIANAALFTIMSFTMLALSHGYPAEQLMFIRVAMGAVVAGILLVIIRPQRPQSLSWKWFSPYVLRSTLSLIAAYCWVKALVSIGINEATAIGYTGLLWEVLFAKLWVGERPFKALYAMLGVSLVGMLLIVRPDAEHLAWKGLIYAMLSTMAWAGYDVICKRQAATEHPLIQVSIVYTNSTLLSAAFAFYSWTPIVPSDYLPFLALGTLGILNVMALFCAFQRASMLLLLPLNYLRLIFTLCISYVLYQSHLPWQALIGALLVLGASSYVFVVTRQQS